MRRAIAKRSRRTLSIAAALALGGAVAARAGLPVPSFAATFLPATVGPGSVSELRFIIDNSGAGAPATDLAFTDVLPAGVTMAAPANPRTTCGGTVTAPDGGGTLSFAGGTVAGFGSCTVAVDVTSAAVGTHTNLSGALTSSAGTSGTASADLTVAVDRPGFGKSFSPSSVFVGARSTLTFTLDNSANPALVFNLAFTDDLPSGLVLAEPVNAATTCSGGTLTAVPGATRITYATGLLGANSICTVRVDVRAVGVGQAVNSSGELSSSAGGPTRSSGKANAALVASASTVALVKDFTDDPVNPGSPATLRFTLFNSDRDFDATGITFTDDLDATLGGLVATGLPLVDPCGPGSVLTGTSLLTLSGGSLAASGGTCSFSVTLAVPGAAAAGAYPNTTSPVSATIGGTPVVGNPASETLYLNDAPQLVKSFLVDPVGAGGSTTLELTITNSSSTSAAADISFRDDLDAFLSPLQVLALPAPGFCGAGSTLITAVIGTQLNLVLAGANLPAGGSCTFGVSLGIPPGTAAGTYVNTTTAITAMVDGTLQTGHAATDTLTVLAAPRLRKSFLDDPVLPGGTATLELTLSYDAFAAAAATGIAFTDDLNATLPGLTALGLPANDVCGAGSQLAGTSTLTLTGGTLAPGATCVFTVTLQVPAAAPAGFHANTTSNVTATVAGVTTASGPAQDRLLVAGLFLAKSFLADPVIPGAAVSLQFTLDNSASADAATGIAFSDNLNATLAGLVAVGPLPATPCGAGSSITGTGNLVFTGGDLAAGATCSFTVTVQVPGAAADGDYVNATSNLTAVIDATAVVLPPASDVLTLSATQLRLEKSFTDDPVQPGGLATLSFTLTNLHPAQAATAIAFTDDLDAALAGLVAVGLPLADVCGAGSQIGGTSLLTFTGGSLAAGASCTFAVTVMVPADAPAGSYVNTTGAASGTIQGLGVVGTPGSDTLRVVAVTFAKSFSGPAVAGGTVQLELTLGNLDAAAAVTSLAFTDDLASVLAGLVATGLPQSDVCGAGSQLSGTTLLTLIGGDLAPGGSCSFGVTLQLPAGAPAGAYLNTTGSLRSAGVEVADPASATLVVEPPPAFAKSFAPATISFGQISTLTFIIDNTASALAATGLAFTDNLPAGVVVATPPNGSSTCTGGTLTAVAGGGVVSFDGGAVAAGASCTVAVDVTSATTGVHANLTGVLSSSSGASGTAGADLAVAGTVLLSKTFVTNPVLPGGTISLEYTITNPDAAAATAIGFSDDLDAALGGLVASGLPVANPCGAGSQLAGTTLLTLSGGSLASGASCTFSATLTVPTAAAVGTYPSSTSPVSATLGGVPGESAGATADLVVAYLDFTKAFTADPAPIGETTGLTFTLTNPDPTNAVSGLTFTDDLDAVLPGLAAVGTPLSDVCGFGSQLAGGALLTLTDGSLAAGGTCTFTVAVAVPQSAPVGTFTNVTSGLDALVGGSPVTGGPASAASAQLHTGLALLAIPALSWPGALLLAGALALLGWRRFGR